MIRHGGFGVVRSLEIFLVVCRALRLLCVRSVDVMSSYYFSTTETLTDLKTDRVVANNNKLFLLLLYLFCCCCLPTHPCLFGSVLPYFEVTGHPVPVSSLGFKCPDCFIWNCSYIVYPSQIKGSYMDNCLRY